MSPILHFSLEAIVTIRGRVVNTSKHLTKLFARHFCVSLNLCLILHNIGDAFSILFHVSCRMSIGSALIYMTILQGECEVILPCHA